MEQWLLVKLQHPMSRKYAVGKRFSKNTDRQTHWYSSSSSLGPVANATDVLQPCGLLYNPIPPSG
jgi:hypothetical protein